MKCRYLVPMRRINHDTVPKSTYWSPAGTVIEHPDAYLLVRMGCAEPADDECHAAHGMSEERMKDARKAYPRVAAGVQPEDYQAFDDGKMLGYKPDGSWKPGPNFTDGDEDDYETDDSEDDDEDSEDVTTEEDES